MGPNKTKPAGEVEQPGIEYAGEKMVEEGGPACKYKFEVGRQGSEKEYDVEKMRTGHYRK